MHLNPYQKSLRQRKETHLSSSGVHADGAVEVSLSRTSLQTDTLDPRKKNSVRKSSRHESVELDDR
jgi:hypothetical protein